MCCSASSHHQFWRDVLHCFLTSSVLERCVALLPHIINFLEEIGRPVAKLETQFQIRFCVLADIFGHVNILLQGPQKQLCNLYEAVNGFDGKLSFFKVHAESGNFLHFHFTREVCGEDEARTEDTKQVFVGVLDSLQTAFNKGIASHLSMTFVAFLPVHLPPSLTCVTSCRRRLESTKLCSRRISSITKLCRA